MYIYVTIHDEKLRTTQWRNRSQNLRLGSLMRVIFLMRIEDKGNLSKEILAHLVMLLKKFSSIYVSVFYVCFDF